MMRIAEDPELAVQATELAETIGLSENGSGRAMGRRLAWMKRYGFVQYDEREHRWALSAAGHRITAAHLKAAQVRALADVPDEAMVEVMAHVTSRYRHGDALMAHLLRREFLFGTQKR
jgi:hypothetical protein